MQYAKVTLCMYVLYTTRITALKSIYKSLFLLNTVHSLTFHCTNINVHFLFTEMYTQTKDYHYTHTRLRINK